MPPEVRVIWSPEQAPVASDGLRGYTFSPITPDGAVLRATTSATVSGRIVLAPGRECVLGWLRFNFPSLQSHNLPTIPIHAFIP
jgi:hypothetical protein